MNELYFIFWHSRKMDRLETYIVSLLQSSDKKAVELIYDNYSDSLYGVILKMLKDENDAQDVLQESFIKIWKNSQKYDPKKAKLFTWLLTICRNKAIDKLRARKNKLSKEVQKADTSVYDNRKVTIKPEHMDLRDKVNTLDSKYIEVIDALFFNGMTQQEASDHLDLPLGTVKSRLRIALRELNKIFGEKLIILIIAISILWMML